MGTSNPWEIVSSSKGVNAYEWFDGDTDGYADGKKAGTNKFVLSRP